MQSQWEGLLRLLRLLRPVPQLLLEGLLSPLLAQVAALAVPRRQSLQESVALQRLQSLPPLRSLSLRQWSTLLQ